MTKLPALDRFYINGKWQNATGTDTHAVISPADESLIGNLSLATVQETELAISAGKNAFAPFRELSLADRLGMIAKLDKLLTDRQTEMAQLISLEMGAPIDYAKAVQVPSGHAYMQAIAGELEKVEFERKLDESHLVTKEPIGLCAAITPWNWPLNQIAIKIIPALAVGCTVVLKPSENTPLSALLFAELIDQAGFPPGSFNLINGRGDLVGVTLASHPLVDMVSFTGSTRAGILVAKNAAPTVKRVALELGGKSPNVIFADADLEAAASGAIDACFGNTGQSCDSASRVLVEKSVYSQFCELVAQKAKQVKLGMPTQAGDHLGPLSNSQQFTKVQHYIEVGEQEAKLLVGGRGRPAGFEQGYYVKPTVFADVTEDMLIAKEEIFGPVLCLMQFEDEADAIAKANNTEYGLSAFLWSSDQQKAMRVARRLAAGAVQINGEALSETSPFGGFKQSGNGREGGVEGIEEFLETKSICFNSDKFK